MNLVPAACLALLLALTPVGVVSAGGHGRKSAATPAGDGWTTERITEMMNQLDDDGGGGSAAPRASTRVRRASGEVSNRRGLGHSADKKYLRRLARSMAIRFGGGAVDPDLYEAICLHESNYERIGGAAGEIGYSQILPSTARPYFTSGQLSGSLWDASTNLKSGVLYLRDLSGLIGPDVEDYMRRHRLSRNAVLAAGYNGGWYGGVMSAVKKNRPLNPRVRSYIHNVVRARRKLDNERD